MKKITTDIIDAIKKANTVMVCGHIRPDGDCIGSSLAMRRICEKLGAKADAVCDGEKLVGFAFMPEYDAFNAPRFDNYDLFIAVDCASEKRLGEYRPYLTKAKHSVFIDHHPTDDRFADINHIDTEAASVCAVIYDLFADTGLIDKEVATMLYVGLSTDTGHFMHSNTTTKVFEAAAALSKYGIDIGAINHALYCNRTLPRIKLISRALGNIRTYAEGRVAIMKITLDDLSECDCGSEDTEGLIDFVKSIGGVEIAISACEQPGGIFRVSFRSVTANVAAAAAVFGGGGHKLASGCVVSGDEYEVIEKVKTAAIAALSGKL